MNIMNFSIGKTLLAFVLSMCMCVVVVAQEHNNSRGEGDSLTEEEQAALEEQLLKINDKLKENEVIKQKLKISPHGESIPNKVLKYNSGGDKAILDSLKSDPSAILAVLRLIKFRGSNEELDWVFSIIDGLLPK